AVGTKGPLYGWNARSITLSYGRPNLCSCVGWLETRLVAQDCRVALERPNGWCTPHRTSRAPRERSNQDERRDGPTADRVTETADAQDPRGPPTEAIPADHPRPVRWSRARLPRHSGSGQAVYPRRGRCCRPIRGRHGCIGVRGHLAPRPARRRLRRGRAPSLIRTALVVGVVSSALGAVGWSVVRGGGVLAALCCALVCLGFG